MFSFRDPLKSLADAGLDVETGNVLSESEAVKTLKSYQHALQLVEQEIQSETLRANIIEVSQANGDLAGLIESSLGRAKTRLHLNRLCRQAESAFVEKSVAASLQNGQSREFKQFFQKQRSLVEKSILNQSREAHGLTRPLLATWLSQRDGYLGEVASAEPCALLIRSDQGEVSWLDETPRELPINHEPQVIHGSQTNKNPTIFDEVIDFVGSLFR